LECEVKKGFFIPEGPVFQAVPDLVKAAMFMGIAKGHKQDAIQIAKADGADVRVMELVRKAAVEGGTTLDPDYAAAASAVAGSVQFAQQLEAVSLFYALYNGNYVNKAPLQSRTIWNVANATGFIRAEGSAVPVSSMSFDKVGGLESRCSAAITIISQELLKAGGDLTQQQIARLIRIATAYALDADFLDRIIDADTPSIASDGPDADDAILDLRSLIEAVTPDATSRLWIAMNPNVQRRAAFLTTMAGGFLFPDLTVEGGNIKGMPCTPCAALADGEIALIDGNRLVTYAETIDILASTQASVEMSNTPTNDGATSTGSSLVSLWQSNLVGFLSRVWFAVDRVNTGVPIAKLTGVQWGGAVNVS
jgi:hypothetical protein